MTNVSETERVDLDQPRTPVKRKPRKTRKIRDLTYHPPKSQSHKPPLAEFKLQQILEFNSTSDTVYPVFTSSIKGDTPVREAFRELPHYGTPSHIENGVTTTPSKSPVKPHVKVVYKASPEAPEREIHFMVKSKSKTVRGLFDSASPQKENQSPVSERRSPTVKVTRRIIENAHSRARKTYRPEGMSASDSVQELKLNPELREKMSSEILHYCHAIAHCFGGREVEKNITAQFKSANQTELLAAENPFYFLIMRGLVESLYHQVNVTLEQDLDGNETHLAREQTNTWFLESGASVSVTVFNEPGSPPYALNPMIQKLAEFVFAQTSRDEEVEMPASPAAVSTSRSTLFGQSSTLGKRRFAEDQQDDHNDKHVCRPASLRWQGP